MLLNGNEAIALGAMAAGCKFMAAYPMTPASTIMEYIANKGSKFNIVMIQPEDEIAAINMAVGAGFAGVRAMTATSAPSTTTATPGSAWGRTPARSPAPSTTTAHRSTTPTCATAPCTATRRAA